jgi:hypothetical protein
MEAEDASYIRITELHANEIDLSCAVPGIVFILSLSLPLIFQQRPCRTDVHDVHNGHTDVHGGGVRPGGIHHRAANRNPQHSARPFVRLRINRNHDVINRRRRV